jgi:GT2 family glycosyltransferase
MPERVSHQEQALRACKLYVQNTLRNYDERYAIEGVGEAHGDWLRTRFVLETLHPPGRVRFDPATEPGIFHVEHIVWRRFDDDAELAEWSGDVLRLGLRPHNVICLPANTGAAAMWAVDDDPGVEIHWPEAALGAGAVVLEFLWSFEAMPIDVSDQLLRAAEVRAEGATPPASPASPVPPVTAAAFEAALDELAKIRQMLETATAARASSEQQQEILRDELQQQRQFQSQTRDEAREHNALLQESLRALAEGLSQLRERQADSDDAWQRNTDRVANLGWRRARRLQQRLRAIVGDGAERHHELKDSLLALQRGVDARLDYISWVQDHPWRARLQRWRRSIYNAARRVWRDVSAFLDLFRAYEFKAVAQGDVTALPDRPDTWQVSGPDPRFHMQPKFSRRIPSAGWYVLDIELSSEGPEMLCAPCLYADYGRGMNEGSRIDLPLHGAGKAHRLSVRFDGDVHCIRLDPTDSRGRVHIGRFRIRKLSWLGAAVRMAWPVLRGGLHSPRQVLRLFTDLVAVWRKEGSRGVQRRVMEQTDRVARANDYASWVQRFDSIDDADRARMQADIAAWEKRPRFSIVMPVYNTPERWLRRCLDTVLMQVYADWELCIADDASTKPHVRTVLEEYAARDARIKVHFRERNGHIVAASNSALELAQGDYMVLLDHDDELPEHALFVVAERLVRDPRAKLIYSDEDKIDEAGRRYEPYFKPDWNPELFHSQNMISHLGVYELALVREVGCFQAGFEGSQDYDLALRCIERLQPENIAHIPHVLYHWRAIEGSTALAHGEKSYAKSAGALALEAHLARCGIAAEVLPALESYHRVRYALPAAPPLVSLIIPTRDRLDLLRLSVGTILEKTTYPNFEILILDNQSREPQTLDYFSDIVRDERVRVIPYDKPFNFSAINNHGARHARGEVLGLINNDVEVFDGEWLGEMMSHALRPGVGAVGSMLYYPDDRIQHAGVVVGFLGVGAHAFQGKPRGSYGPFGRAKLLQNLSCVTAACLLLRREIFAAVGGLEEDLEVAFNDVDFCLRILDTGNRIVWTPYAELYHHESASRGLEDSPEKLARFTREVEFMRKRYGARLLADAAYNPNLSLDVEPYVLAWPPRVHYAFRTDATRDSGAW